MPDLCAGESSSVDEKRAKSSSETSSGDQIALTDDPGFF
jgi:hypothetical protein